MHLDKISGKLYFIASCNFRDFNQMKCQVNGANSMFSFIQIDDLCMLLQVLLAYSFLSFLILTPNSRGFVPECLAFSQCYTR